jgi:hypothetical protein
LILRGKHFSVRILVGFALIVSSARAEGPRIERLEIIESGVYSGENKDLVPDPGVAGGQRIRSSNLKLETSTDKVPAKVGVIFGFRYKIVGEPLGAVVELKFITRFPPGTRPPNSSRDGLPPNEFTLPRTVGDIFYRGYGLDGQWELVQGDWTFEIWSGDRKLLDKTFSVYLTR